MDLDESGHAPVVCRTYRVNFGHYLWPATLALGPHSIKAVYQGDGSFTGGTSTATIQSVGQDATTTIVTSSANPSPPNHALTLTADVVPAAPGGGTPTGTVEFLNGKKVLGTVALHGVEATLTIKKLALGTHSITVVYQGDSDFKASTGTALKQVVKKPAKARPKPKPKAQLDVRQNGRPRQSVLIHDLALEQILA